MQKLIKLTERWAFPLYFAMRSVRQVAEHNYAWRSFEKSGFKTASFESLIRAKKSDTLFILGSGASVNSISPKQWQSIKMHDSLGLNFWIYHQFVPTFHMFELPADKAAFAGMKRMLMDRTDYAGCVRILNYSSLVECYECDLQFMKKDVFGAHRFVLPGRTEERMLRSLHYFFNSRIFPRINWIPFYRGSVFQAVMLGYMLKYRNIVLAGVDLNGSRYFWEEHDVHNRVEVRAPEVHGTMTPSVHAATMTASILGLDRDFLRPRGVTLSLANSNSALFPFLDLHVYE